MEELRVGLINGRHEMPVDKYIFDEIKDVMDFKFVNKVINNFLEQEVGVSIKYGTSINQCDYTDVQCFKGNKRLVVYVTGLTSVTASLIGACARNGIKLSLMHFDRNTGKYVEQVIF